MENKFKKGDKVFMKGLFSERYKGVITNVLKKSYMVNINKCEYNAYEKDLLKRK